MTDPASLSRGNMNKLGRHLTGLYMAGIGLKILPPWVFTSLPQLQWLDVRDNRLMVIPDVIASHQALKV